MRNIRRERPNVKVDQKRIKVLIAKPGLDGHDRGAKVLSLALRDAGMEVIYTGLHQTVEQIVQTAIDEDVDVIGLSILSGAHLSICRKLCRMLAEKGITGVLCIVGGRIPVRDIPALKEMGIAEVFCRNETFEEIASFIRQGCAQKNARKLV